MLKYVDRYIVRRNLELKICDFHISYLYAIEVFLKNILECAVDECKKKKK